MPFVQVSMGTGRTPEQKRALLEGISDVVHTTLGADYDSIKVWIVELDPDDVMLGQETLAERRADDVTERGVIEPRSEVVPLRDLEFHFLDWGDRDAPPVLFLHGFAGHAWQTIFPAQVLADDHWVIALDQRGHGDTAWADVYGSVPAVADVVAFLDWLGIERTAVVGHSMGGINALCLSGLHPKLVTALVLGDIGPETNRAGTDRIQQIVRARDTFASVDEAFEHEMALNPTSDPVARRSRVEHNLRENADGTVTWKYDPALRNGTAHYENYPRDDQWAFWHALTVPTLLLRGALSDVLTPEIAARMIETNPNARIVTLPGSGHSIATDVPDLVTAALADFLA